jgi:acid phosphatase family membrane protein YuiD
VGWNAGIVALLSGLVAQAAKVVWELVAARRWRPLLFFANGGMPSSHAATVTTLALLVRRDCGAGSPMFSLALVFGVFVLFEATGLRQEIGKQARLLNDLREALEAGGPWPGGRLRELVGHTWGEVAGGIVVGVLAYLWLGGLVGPSSTGGVTPYGNH